MKRFLFVAAATVLAAGTLDGQATPDSVKHRNDCRLARQVVVTGHPVPHLRWALGYLAGCGAGEQGAAVAQAVRRLRAETDTSVLRPYWSVTGYLLDRRLFEAAEEIAIDRSASTQARVFATSALISVVRPGFISDYSQLVGGFRPDGLVAGGCWSVASGKFQRTDTPLPVDYQERIAAVRQRLRGDPTEPLDVRTAATCLLPRRR
jgi:hypothetical protein